MNASKVSVTSIKEWEKCKLKAYKDGKGKWTIGWGQTGKDIVEGLVWTQEQADAALVETVKAHAKALSSALTGATTQAQFDAMLSLSYNIGRYALATSTVLRQHNAGNYRDAAAAFLMWNKITIGGALTYSEGLNKRRHAEKLIYQTIVKPVEVETAPEQVANAA